MPNNRDDFSQKTKELLAKRVGYRCSNPHCRKFTCGAAEKPDSYVNIGVAAHICAAAWGGKRFDESMTTKERKDIRNGIWLCQSCAKLIDSDESRYTVELLHRWKSQAENEVLQKLESGSIEPVHVSPPDFDELLDMVFSCDSRDKAIGLAYKLNQEIDRLVATLEDLQAKIDKNKENSNLVWNEIYSSQFESKLLALRSLDMCINNVSQRICYFRDEAYAQRDTVSKTDIVTIEKRVEIPRGGGGANYSFDFDLLPVVEVVCTDKARSLLMWLHLMWDGVERSINELSFIQRKRQNALADLRDLVSYENK